MPYQCDVADLLRFQPLLKLEPRLLVLFRISALLRAVEFITEAQEDRALDRRQLIEKLIDRLVRLAAVDVCQQIGHIQSQHQRAVRMLIEHGIGGLDVKPSNVVFNITPPGSMPVAATYSANASAFCPTLNSTSSPRDTNFACVTGSGVGVGRTTLGMSGV